MKRPSILLTFSALAAALLLSPPDCPAMFSWFLDRDAECLNQYYKPPCQFPLALNPCAVPCRPPVLQPQAVPCAFKTACPADRLPCHGVSYGDNPYPLFHLR